MCVDDAINTCIQRGHVIDYLFELDCDSFGALYSSIMRIKAREDMRMVYMLSLAQNPGKKGENSKKFLEALKAWLPKIELKQGMKSAKDFIALHDRGN